MRRSTCMYSTLALLHGWVGCSRRSQASWREAGDEVPDVGAASSSGRVEYHSCALRPCSSRWASLPLTPCELYSQTRWSKNPSRAVTAAASTLNRTTSGDPRADFLRRGRPGEMRPEVRHPRAAFTCLDATWAKAEPQSQEYMAIKT